MLRATLWSRPSVSRLSSGRFTQRRFALGLEVLEDRTLLNSTYDIPGVLSPSPVASLTGFVQAGVTDRASITLTRGETIAVAVNAQRYGGGLDSYLQVLDPSNNVVAANDNSVGTDAGLTFQADANGVYKLAVSASTVGKTSTSHGLFDLTVTNLGTKPLRPDLVGGSFRVQTPVAEWGDTVTANYTIENRGGAPAGPFATEIRLSADGHISPTGPLLGTVTVGGVPADGSVSGTVTVQLPSKAPAGFSGGGAVWLGERIDPAGVVADADPLNNNNQPAGADRDIISLVSLAQSALPKAALVSAIPLTGSLTGGTLSVGSTVVYSINVRGPQTLSAVATAVAGGLQPEVSLYGPNGQLLVQSVGPTQTSTSAGVQLPNLDGPYFLAVAPRPGSTGANTPFVLQTKLAPTAGYFNTAQVFPTAGAPYNLLVADLNGDGLKDLVSWDSSDNTVSVLFGAAGGSFDSPVTITMPANVQEILAGDLNGDGAPDLIVIESTAIVVLMNDGRGGFNPAATGETIPDPNAPVAAALTDLNRDGTPDLVVADSSDISVYLGTTTNGPFNPTPVTTAVTNIPKTLAVADTNHDGIPDVILASDEVTTGPQGGTVGDVTVFLGATDGTLTPGTPVPLNGSPTALAAADVNGDGSPDVAVVSSYSYTNTTTNSTTRINDQVTVLFGNGSGGFTATPFTAAVPESPNGVTLADVNGDGHLDLLVSNSSTLDVLLGTGASGPAAFGSGRLQSLTGTYAFAVADLNGDGTPDVIATDSTRDSIDVLFGAGTGVFQTSQVPADEPSPAAVAVADLNGDGLPDLVVVNYGNSFPTTDGSVSVLLATGTGTFIARTPIPLAGFYGGQVTVGDVNGDGIPDLLVSVQPENNATNPGNVDVFLGQGALGKGTGNFTLSQPVTVGTNPGPIFLQDVNGDHRPDLLVLNTNDDTVSLALNAGSGTFSAPAIVPGSQDTTGLAVADVNGDGLPDLLLLQNDTINVLLGQPGGTFLAGASVNVGSARSFVAGDLTGSGTTDLAVVSSVKDQLHIFLGDGAGHFTSGAVVAVLGGADTLSVGDMNNDGKPDLVATNSTVGVEVFLGDGVGNFVPGAILPADVGSQAVLADVAADGTLDLVTSSQYRGVRILTGSGSATSSFDLLPLSLGSGGSIAVADINGDGQPDLLLSGYGTTVDVLLGNVNGSFTPAPTSVQLGFTPGQIDTADVNRDGRTDLIVSEPYGATPLLHVFLGNGDGTFTPVPQGPISLDAAAEKLMVADVTGDGIPDIVTLGGTQGLFNYNEITVLTGDGFGGFNTHHSYTFAGSPQLQNVVAGDANGQPVLLVSDAAGSGVHVLTVGATGSLSSVLPDVTLPADGTPGALAIGDLAGDGKPDLVVADYTSGKVYVFSPNTTDGSWDGVPAPYKIGSYHSSLAVADLNGDGRQDVIVVNNFTNSVTVLLSRPGGVLVPGQTLPVGSYPTKVVAMDVNHDGIPDIIVGNSDHTVSVFLGNGDGTFRDSPPSSSLPPQNVPQLADLNGDGLTDAITLDRFGNLLYRQGTSTQGGRYASPVIINPGTPTAAFTLFRTPAGYAVAAIDRGQNSVSMYSLVGGVWQRTAVLAAGNLPVRIAAADLTGAGLDDLVVVNQFDDTVSIFLQTPDGTFAAPLTRAVGTTPSAVSFADVDRHDGLDILVAGQLSGDVTVLFNDPTHSFQTQARALAGTGSYEVLGSGDDTSLVSLNQTIGVVAGRFRGPAAPVDLVTLNSVTNTITLLEGAGGGAFLDPNPALSIGTDPGAVDLVSGVFTPSGLPDLAVLVPGANQVWIYLSRGDGTFAPPVKIDTLTTPSGLSIADVNHDGNLDLVIGNAFGDLLVLYGNGQGDFFPQNNASAVSFVVGNFSGTGQNDVVSFNKGTDQVQSFDRIAGASGANSFTQGTLSQSRSDGVLAPVSSQKVALTDARGVQQTYVVAANSGGNTVVVYHLLTDGTWSSQAFAVGTNPSGVTLAYFNGSALPSLVVANQGSNDVSILFGAGDADNWTLTNGPRYAAGTGPVSTSVQTINGNIDLVVIDSNGTVMGLTGINNTGFFAPAKTVTLGSLGGAVTVPVGGTLDMAGGSGTSATPLVITQAGVVEQLTVTASGTLSEAALFSAPAGSDVTYAQLTTIAGVSTLLIGETGPAGGEVQVLQADSQGEFTQVMATFVVTNPSAVQLVESGGVEELYVAEAGTSEPIVFELESNAITLPETSPPEPATQAVTEAAPPAELTQAGLASEGAPLPVVLANPVEDHGVASAEPAPTAPVESVFASNQPAAQPATSVEASLGQTSTLLTGINGPAKGSSDGGLTSGTEQGDGNLATASSAELLTSAGLVGLSLSESANPEAIGAAAEGFIDAFDSAAAPLPAELRDAAILVENALTPAARVIGAAVTPLVPRLPFGIKLGALPGPDVDAQASTETSTPAADTTQHPATTRADAELPGAEFQTTDAFFEVFSADASTADALTAIPATDVGGTAGGVTDRGTTPVSDWHRITLADTLPATLAVMACWRLEGTERRSSVRDLGRPAGARA